MSELRIFGFSSGAVVSAILVFFAFILFATVLVMWWRDYKLFSSDLFKILRISKHLAHNSPNGSRYLFFSTIAFICLTVLTFFKLPLNLWSIAIVVVAMCTMNASAALRAPAAIVLCASRSAYSRQLAYFVFQHIGGYHVCFLVGSNPPSGNESLEKTEAYPLLFSDSNSKYADRAFNRYLKTDTAWEPVIVELLDMIPIIVVDASATSDGLMIEVDRILNSPNLFEKTLVFTGGIKTTVSDMFLYNRDFPFIHVISDPDDLKRYLVYMLNSAISNRMHE